MLTADEKFVGGADRGAFKGNVASAQSRRERQAEPNGTGKLRICAAGRWGFARISALLEAGSPAPEALVNPARGASSSIKAAGYR